MVVQNDCRIAATVSLSFHNVHVIYLQERSLPCRTDFCQSGPSDRIQYTPAHQPFSRCACQRQYRSQRSIVQICQPCTIPDLE